MMNFVNKISLSVLIAFGTARLSSQAPDYSKMSKKELNEAFVLAVKGHYFDDVRDLVRAGADVNQTTTYQETRGDMDFDVTVTVLEYAAKKNYVDIVKELIKAKRVKKEDIGWALVAAAEKGSMGVVEELLRAKPSINALNRALKAAAESFPGKTNVIPMIFPDLTDVIKALLKAGADANYVENDRGTVLMKIIKSDCSTESRKFCRAYKVEIIEALLAAKANVNYADKNGDTALIAAVRGHDVDAVEILLKAPDINLNHADNYGNTALIIALNCIQYTYIRGDYKGHNDCVNSQEILRKLLEIPGIDLYHANKKGDTAIKLLKQFRQDVQGCV